ncbi:type I-E CRISPR-associated endoribonuclease Cas2e [Pseudactinotalea sp. Z1732]|uniref:type I-E CRISPR-associated endoribonuclease Cas2e n=1 Tax=Micrococcales TaxID=85006 RepID=UPI003C7A3516
MTVVVLTAVPAGLRGVLTRWLLEIAPGVFVGHVSRRVREHLWDRIVDGVGRGRALMVFQQRSEQRLGFWVHGHDWEPIDFEGLSLMLRPEGDGSTDSGQFAAQELEFRRTSAAR